MIRNYLKYILYFVFFAVLGAGGAYIYFAKINNERTGEVPSLVGKSVTEAKELLNKRKLDFNIEGKDYHEEIPDGHIARQLVGPGVKKHAGYVVGIIVSRGKGQGHEQSMFLMPSFEEHLFDEAKQSLNDLDLRLGKVTWVHSDTVEKGKIIAQRPVPGSINIKEIHFLISLGPYDVIYRCPSFVNMAAEDARKLSENLGIILIEQNEGNKIVSQRPEDGAIIRKGDSVEVTLGNGRQMWF